MNIKNIILITLAIFGVTLFLVLQKDSKDYNSSANQPQAPVIAQPAARYRAPDFTLTDLEENEIRLSDSRGRVVAMLFWTTWWPSCREELPSLDKFKREYEEKGVQVLLINMSEKSPIVASFMKENDYSSRVLLDSEGQVAKKYDVFGIPVSYLIDKEGRVVYRLSGVVDWSSREIRSLVNNLISE